MTPTSQNGWSVIFSDQAAAKTQVWNIPNADGKVVRSIRLRKGAAGFLLTCVAAWFHEHIERIDVGTYDDWGWAVRPIRGQTSGYSNHASGTAEDLNSTSHPRGVKGTFSVTEKAEVHKHLKRYAGVIRWGEDYSGTVDGMHFECNAGRAAVVAVFVKMRLTRLGKRVREAQKEAP